jgi:hypothetical protein
MFNLDDAISEWRKQMIVAGIKQTASLDELEEHLRSDVEQQTRSGLDAEAAFSNAAARIGAATRVREEFKKVRPRPGAAFEGWISAGATLFIAFTLVFFAIVFYAVRMTAGQLVAAFAGICLLLVIGCGWRYAVPYVPVYSGKRQRIGVIALWCSLTISVGFLPAIVLPAIMDTAFDQGSLDSTRASIVTLIWAIVPVAFAICLVMALMMNDKERARWGMTRPENMSKNKDRYA